MSEKLQQLKTSIEAAVTDLATLEVASFTGSQIDLSGAATTDGFDSTKVFEAIRKGLPTATLVGYSKFEIDGDTINYLNSDLGEGKQYLLDGHSTLVEGAQSTRKDFFEFILKAVQDII